ncbi:hypothetical protein HZS_4348 [Henneguya salminicola]|nr:hypothetical protein HZS_4348 [Henneguya salminicola]
MKKDYIILLKLFNCAMIGILILCHEYQKDKIYKKNLNNNESNSLSSAKPGHCSKIGINFFIVILGIPFLLIGFYKNSKILQYLNKNESTRLNALFLEDMISLVALLGCFSCPTIIIHVSQLIIYRFNKIYTNI